MRPDPRPAVRALTRTDAPRAEVWLPLLREALAREGAFRLPLRGDSMAPTLPSACEIEVVPLPGEPAAGELIVFALADALVAHRLTRRASNGWIAQGDNRRVADPALTREQILGRVAAAYAGAERVWPRRGERVAAGWWIARARALGMARAAARRFGLRA